MPNPVPPSQALFDYLADAAVTPLSDTVRDATVLHVMDTVAAMVSGSQLPAGRLGVRLGCALGGPPQALIVGTDHLVGAAAAALANGMAAHADETDDSHAPSLSHPGCAVVPAALATAERCNSSGELFLRAVAAGYDVGCRIGRALGRDAVDLRHSRPSSHAIVSTFGAAAAAAVLQGANRAQCAHILSYAAQRATGVTTWQRDPDHLEKAYDFAGSPAHSGILAALAVAEGGTGVHDVFDGAPNYLNAVSAAPNPDELSADLGSRYEITLTNIKRYSVGSPAQAAVQAAEELLTSYRLNLRELRRIDIVLPADLAGVVDERSMPDVNVQYLVAGTLLDGRCTFEMSHDVDRMDADDVKRLRHLTTVVPDEDRAGTRSAEVRLHLSMGTVLARTVDHVAGTAENPMSAEQIQAKAIDVMRPSLGQQRSRAVAAALADVGALENMRALRDLLRPKVSA